MEIMVAISFRLPTDTLTSNSLSDIILFLLELAYGNAGQSYDVGQEVASDGFRASASPASFTEEGNEGENLVIAHTLKTNKTTKITVFN